MFDPIRVGTLSGNIEPVNDGNKTRVFKGFINTKSQYDIPVFAKPLNEDDTIKECICAKLGQALNLPIPEPFLIVSDHEEFAESEGFGFASSLIPHRSIKVAINWESEHEYSTKTMSNILAELIAWKDYPVSCLFDEWISNQDRHIGNILFGGKGIFYLIDHADALHIHLPVNHATKNYFVSKAKIDKLSFEKIKKEIFERVLKSLIVIDRKQLLKSVRADLYHPAPDPFADFLCDRRNHLSALLKYNLGVDDDQGELELQ